MNQKPEGGVLCLTVRPGEEIKIGKSLVFVKQIWNKGARIYIKAPKEIPVQRTKV